MFGGIASTIPKSGSNSPHGSAQGTETNSSVTTESEVSAGAGPKLVQTNNYDFRIATHEITTNSSFLYVTPGGNYSFSKSCEQCLSYVSLKGNQSVILSTFYLTTGSISSTPPFTPSAVTETMNSTFYDVCLTYSPIGGDGQLCTGYNFGQTPVQIISKFIPNSGNALTLGLAWATAGEPYIDASLSSQGQDVASALSLTELGNYSSFVMSPTSTIGHSFVSVNYADFGEAPIYYGPFVFGGITYYAGVVVFHSNDLVIDPSIVQENYNVCASSPCQASFDSDMTTGDAIIASIQIYAGNAVVSSVSDSMSDSYSKQIEQDSFSCGYVTDCSSALWSSTATSSSSDTVSVYVSASSDIAVEIFEVSGIFSTASATGEGEGTGLTASTSSVSFSGSPFLLASLTSQSGGCTATSGFTCYSPNTYGSSFYSTSGVSSPTTFQATVVNSEWNDVGAAFGPAVTQPITATLSGSGANRTVSVSGCSASPSTFSGGGSSNSITATPLCNLTLSLPTGPPFYVWEATGLNSMTLRTCSSGTCGSRTLHYLKYVQPINNPNDFVNTTGYLTGLASTVYVNLFNSTNNFLTGDSCGKPPCTPYNGISSFQFNVVFPRHDNFTVQEVVEIDAISDVCYAHAQNADAHIGPNTTRYDFSCSEFLLNPGDNFEWIIDSTSGIHGTFTDTKFMLDGTMELDLSSSDVFNATGISMNDTYAQSSLVGGYSPTYTYANIFSGNGFMTYSGVSDFNTYCPVTHVCSFITTGEYSDVEYTAIPMSSPFNQTYYSGTFVSAEVPSGSGSTGAGSLSDASDVVGPPDSNVAELDVPSSGSSAVVEGTFGAPYNGTIAIDGESYGVSGSSAVEVQVSSTGSVWTTVYNESWVSSTSLNYKYVLVTSARNTEYVKVFALYNGTSADLLIDAINIYSGSFAQANTASGHASPGSVTNPARVVGLNDSSFAELQAPSTGTNATVEISFGTQFGGKLSLDMYSDSPYTSSMIVNGSSDGVHWTTLATFTLSPSSDSWIQISSNNYIPMQYVNVIVYYSPLRGESNLYLDAFYIA